MWRWCITLGTLSTTKRRRVFGQSCCSQAALWALIWVKHTSVFGKKNNNSCPRVCLMYTYSKVVSFILCCMVLFWGVSFVNKAANSAHFKIYTAAFRSWWSYKEDVVTICVWSPRCCEVCALITTQASISPTTLALWFIKTVMMLCEASLSHMVWMRPCPEKYRRDLSPNRIPNPGRRPSALPVFWGFLPLSIVCSFCLRFGHM